MYQVSQAYKESMKSRMRNHSYLKVMLGLVNQEAQSTAEVQNTTQYSDYTGIDTIYERRTDKTYATYERDTFKADGSMMFLPTDKSKYIKRGLTSKNLFSSSYTIKFVFGYGKTSIKGLSIQFGENYPTKFSVTTSDGTITQYDNNNSYFETEDLFDDTSSIEIKVTKMLKTNGRVRLEWIIFGLGLEYGNDWIISADTTSSVSMINEDLPEMNFSVKLNNETQIFNVDNPSSEINFLETGQKVDVKMGYELDDGSIEWLQQNSLYVYEWSADDDTATIKAVDRLKFMSDSYYKGQYHAEGISLYDLATDVLQDANIDSEDYYLDSYLKKVMVNNPLPNVGHKEALQIIANAGRCILDYDRYGRIRIYSAFIPEATVTSNGETTHSKVGNIVKNTPKKHYATYEKNYWLANGGMEFLPSGSVDKSECGYVSSRIANSDGTFSTPPMLTLALESLHKCFGLSIDFSGNPPTKMQIKTYADGELRDDITISKDIVSEYTLYREFSEFDTMTVSFLETLPQARIHVDYIALGDETDYKVEYDDLFSTPVGTQLDKIKNVNVTRSIYTSSETIEELTSDKLTLESTETTYYFDYACYGYSVSIKDAKSGQSVSIVDSGAYFVTVSFSGIAMGTEIEVIIQGYKFNVSNAIYSLNLNNRGNDKEWNNPIVSDYEHSKDIAAWLADYLSSGIQYELDFRGEPAIDAGDIIYQENRYDDNLKTIVEESQLSFDGTISGALLTRRLERVDRT